MFTSIFSLAVTEDAQKVNGTAKLGGGEEAEVSNPFYTCTYNLFLFDRIILLTSLLFFFFLQ